MTNKRLDNLIKWLTRDVDETRQLPDSKYKISNASRDELLQELNAIKAELAPLGEKWVPWQPDTDANHAPQNSKLMNKFGVPLKLNGGESIIKDMDITARPDEHPMLVLTYLYMGEQSDESDI